MDLKTELKKYLGVNVKVLKAMAERMDNLEKRVKDLEELR